MFSCVSQNLARDQQPRQDVVEQEVQETAHQLKPVGPKYTFCEEAKALIRSVPHLDNIWECLKALFPDTWAIQVNSNVVGALH